MYYTWNEFENDRIKTIYFKKIHSITKFQTRKTEIQKLYTNAYYKCNIN